MKYILGFFLLFNTLFALNQEQRNTLIIYFGFNEFELSNTAHKQIKEVFELVRQGEFYVEKVTAYTDLNGDFEYNKQLAERRIQTVEKAIKSYNFNIIEKNAAGENYPKNAENLDDYKYWRRVEIQYLVVPPTLEIEDVPHSQTNSDFNIEIIKSSKKSVTILNIEFVPGEDVLIGESYNEIDKLYEFLNVNNEVYAFIRGHVCCANDYSLSSARAHAVYLILAQKGIETKRLRYEGFSNSIPVVSPEITDDDRQKNRRVDVIFSSL
jgi:outer membrane protein OmpA-like peptidoglycan-associated protein